MIEGTPHAVSSAHVLAPARRRPNRRRPTRSHVGREVDHPAGMFRSRTRPAPFSACSLRPGESPTRSEWTAQRFDDGLVHRSSLRRTGNEDVCSRGCKPRKRGAASRAGGTRSRREWGTRGAKLGPSRLGHVFAPSRRMAADGCACASETGSPSRDHVRMRIAAPHALRRRESPATPAAYAKPQNGPRADVRDRICFTRSLVHASEPELSSPPIVRTGGTIGWG